MHPERVARVILTYEMEDGEVLSFEHKRPEGGWCPVMGRLDVLERYARAVLREDGHEEVKFERVPWPHNSVTR